MKQQTERMAEVHQELSSEMYSAAGRLTDFVSRQKAEFKTVWSLTFDYFVEITRLGSSTIYHLYICLGYYYSKMMKYY